MWLVPQNNIATEYFSLLPTQEELFGDTVNNIWNENHLQYLGMIFMIPRAICLLILIFGMMTASLFVCTMRIIQSIEPRNIVSAYGKVRIKQCRMKNR